MCKFDMQLRLFGRDMVDLYFALHKSMYIVYRFKELHWRVNKKNDNEYLNRTSLTNQTNNENCISSLQVFVGTYSTIFKKIVFQGLEKKVWAYKFFYTLL